VCLLEASFRNKCFELYAIEVSDNQHRRWCEALTFHPVNLCAHSTDFLAELFGMLVIAYRDASWILTLQCEQICHAQL